MLAQCSLSRSVGVKNKLDLSYYDNIVALPYFLTKMHGQTQVGKTQYDLISQLVQTNPCVPQL